jgi:hypothetical protein
LESSVMQNGALIEQLRDHTCYGDATPFKSFLPNQIRNKRCGTGLSLHS